MRAIATAGADDKARLRAAAQGAITPGMTATPTKPRARWLFAAAVIAGFSFWPAAGQADKTLPGIAWKGAGVAVLAVWALCNARNRGGWLIAIVLAFGALGDVLLERSPTVGAAAFLAGHLAATCLYGSYRRAHRSPSQSGLGLVLLVGVPIIAFLLPADRAAAPAVAVYATGLGAMAASAWVSRFPRYRVGSGAVLFVASDLLIFARLGPLAASPVPRLLIWPLYFTGQALIAFGVVTALLEWKNDDDLYHRL